MSVYTHREDDYLQHALQSFSFGNPATPAPRLDDADVGPTDTTPRPSVVAVPAPLFSSSPGPDVELSSDDDVFDYDDDSMRIEVSSARFSDGRRASLPSEESMYERERENSVTTVRRRGSAFEPSTIPSVSTTAASDDGAQAEAHLDFDIGYIINGIADGSSNVSDFVRRPSAISLAPNTTTPRGSAGQLNFLWSWGGLNLRRPSTATVATTSTGSAGIFQHDDSFARNLLHWGGEGYREQRKDWTFRRTREEDLSGGAVTSLVSPSSGTSLFSARTVTADHEESRSRSFAHWKGMVVGSEEIWTNDNLGRFLVLREDIGRKPDQESISVKGPQQRLLVRDRGHRDSRPEHPPVIVHKHSKTTAFSISRYYKPHSAHHPTNAASPRPSTVASGAAVTSQGHTPSNNRKIILLATRKVQEAFTSTKTTGMLADHGLLDPDAERRKQKEKDREKEKEKYRKQRGDSSKGKDKGKEKQEQESKSSKERRKSVLTGRRKNSHPHSNAEGDRGTKSEGFVSGEGHRHADDPSDSDVGVMSAPERLRSPPHSTASSVSGHEYGSPLPFRPPQDTSLPYDSSASASSTTSLHSSASTSVSTSASASYTSPSSSNHRPPPPPPPGIRKHKPRRTAYDHEHDGYYQDWEEDDEYDDDEDDYLNGNDHYNSYGYDSNGRLRRRRVDRTPHSETYSVVTISEFNSMQKQLRNNHHHLSYEGKLSLFDRLTGRTGKVTGKALTKDPSAREGILRAGPAGRLFEPPWVTFPSRDKQEEQRKVINNLNHSFQDVGLLPSIPKDMKQKDKEKWTGKDGKKKDDYQRRGSTRGGGNARGEKQDDEDDYDVFANIPVDSLYMLLPLWPGDTDHHSQRDHPYTKPNIRTERERRLFLLVCYKELESEPPNSHTSSSSNTLEGSRETTGTLRSHTSSVDSTFQKRDEKKDDKNILLPGFIITARHLTYADLQGSGVKAPDEGITVFGPMEEAIKDMPGTPGLEGYDTSNYLWSMGGGIGGEGGEGGDESIYPGSGYGGRIGMDDKTIRAMDTFVGVCHSRESGVELDPEALRALGLCRLLNPLPPGKIAEEVEEEQRKLAMRYELTPVGKAVVQMIWIGGLALTSFGPV
ncbi:hypothetical protein D9758_006399 [Tetrapyrgos nigripes]|uniref:Uncharacterized protein n=1 Tax=Tetrapyrgos nigripes TaxID=182062 RepID=A0A8H5DA39_9AGAR|nr:hypothetical protein D9758_006399 [Tetrapyrgos nigripes]